MHLLYYLNSKIHNLPIFKLITFHHLPLKIKYRKLSTWKIGQNRRICLLERVLFLIILKVQFCVSCIQCHMLVYRDPGAYIKC